MVDANRVGPPSGSRLVIVHSLVESLRCRAGESRALQERKRIVLRFLACHYKLKTYFGIGHFHYTETKAVHDRALELLFEFPKPPGLLAYQEMKYFPLLGEERLATPPNMLDDLEARAEDPLPVLEAKREALLEFLFQRCESHTHGRPWNYRHTFDPNTYVPNPDNPLSRTMGKEMFHDLMQPVLGILRTHLPHCDPLVRKALEKHVLGPYLPFDIELPD
jgi:hypothetical protein